MAGLNKCQIIGNLGADPEVRNLQTGSSVASFNVAVSESYTNKSGEKVTNTEWFRIECWEGLARVAEQYLKKGSQVYIEGKLRTEEYQDKDGVTRYVTKVRTQNLTMLGSANGGNNNQGQNGYQQQAPAQQAAPQAAQNNGYQQQPARQQQAPQNNGYKQQAPTQQAPQNNGYQQAPTQRNNGGYQQAPQQQAAPQNINNMPQGPNNYNNEDDLPF